MLRELRIKDFTIIDDLKLSFDEGFNVLTGETGAGKSIIVDALGLLLGEKADSDLIRNGCEEARIEAFFDPEKISLLEELDVDCSEGIILRRQISAKGKSRAFINDICVSLQTMAVVGRSLVDIYGQHEHQALLKKESHLEILDSFGGLEEDARSLGRLYEEVSKLRQRIESAKKSLQEREQKIEYLRFQISEIECASLSLGEKESLEEERSVLINAGKLRESAEETYSLLYGEEGSAIERLYRIANNVKEISRIDRNAEDAAAILQSALPLLEDASSMIRKLKETYDVDPDRLNAIEERLELIRRLEKKYGGSVEKALNYCEKAREDLKCLEHADEYAADLEKEFADKSARLSDLAAELTEKRRAAAYSMSALMAEELLELGFRQAELKIDMRRRDEICLTGMDEVEFLFSANPGEPPRPLAKVASGGELSRIMLGLKCVEIKRNENSLSAAQRRHGDNLFSCARTLIFDEVDAGIGGATAKRIGARLRRLAGDYQILCITHLPQIAAGANSHLKIDKELLGDRVKVVVSRVEGASRQVELARMLGGSVTEKSLSHAEEMLEQGKKVYN